MDPNRITRTHKQKENTLVGIWEELNEFTKCLSNMRDRFFYILVVNYQNNILFENEKDFNIWSSKKEVIETIINKLDNEIQECKNQSEKLYEGCKFYDGFQVLEDCNLFLDQKRLFYQHIENIGQPILEEESKIIRLKISNNTLEPQQQVAELAALTDQNIGIQHNDASGMNSLLNIKNTSIEGVNLEENNLQAICENLDSTTLENQHSFLTFVHSNESQENEMEDILASTMNQFDSLDLNVEKEYNNDFSF